MYLCYNKLWKMLIDRGLKKKDLPALAGISIATVTKLAKNAYVNTLILEKLCCALQCDISDIVEMSGHMNGNALEKPISPDELDLPVSQE